MSSVGGVLDEQCGVLDEQCVMSSGVLDEQRSP